MTHGKVNIGATAGDGRLVFAAEQTVAAQPAERAFDDPAVRKNFEPFDVVAAFHDFQFPPECLSCCFDQFAGVSAVGPDELQSRMALPGIFAGVSAAANAAGMAALFFPECSPMKSRFGSG